MLFPHYLPGKFLTQVSLFPHYLPGKFLTQVSLQSLPGSSGWDLNASSCVVL